MYIFHIFIFIFSQVCAENFLASLDNYYCKVSNSYIILFSLIFADGEIPGVCTREAILSKINVLASKLHTGGDHSISCTPPTSAEAESQNVSNHLSLILLPLRDILLCALDTLPGTDGIRHSLRFRWVWPTLFITITSSGYQLSFFRWCWKYKRTWIWF